MHPYPHKIQIHHQRNPPTSRPREREAERSASPWNPVRDVGGRVLTWILAYGAIALLFPLIRLVANR